MADVAKKAVHVCTFSSHIFKEWHLCKIDEFVFISNPKNHQRGNGDQLLSVVNDFKEWISFCHRFDDACLNINEVGARHFCDH